MNFKIDFCMGEILERRQKERSKDRRKKGRTEGK
jgi:hypothetical protein